MSPLSYPDILLRVLLAFLAGFVIGWERQSHGRPAGLRTTILACVAAAVAMIVSETLFTESAAGTPPGSWRPDPARLCAGILTGIGFLGAGTILRHDNFARGVTTAASLWFVTVLGLAFGCGRFALGLLGTAVALLTLFVLPRFERHIRTDWFATLTILLTPEAPREEELRKRIEALGLSVKTIRLSHDAEKRQRTIVYELKLRKAQLFQMSNKAVSEMMNCTGVVRVEWD